MVHITAEYGRKELAVFFQTKHPLTGRKPRVGLAADKVTDAGGVQSEIVNARFNYNGTPVTVCLALAEIGDDYGDGVAEAGGFACFQKIVETVEQYGIICFEGDGPTAVSVLDKNGQHEQISCFVADGELVYRSEDAGVNHYLHHHDGLGDPTILTHWDPPHAIDILKSHAQSDYVKQMHAIIKEVWSHFSRSPKRSRQLEKFVAKQSGEWLNLHYLFEIRFVESEYKALLAFAKDLALIVKFLQAEQREESTDGVIKAKIVGWLRMLRSLKFITSLLTSIDIDEQLKILSKETQSDSSLVIYYPEQRQNCFTKLKQLQTGLGVNSKSRLEDLRRGRYTFDKIKRAAPPQTLVRDEHSSGGGGGGGGSYDFDNDDDDSPTDEYVEVLMFGIDAEHVAEYVLNYQKEQVDAMVLEFDDLVANVEVYTHLATVLRFDAMLTELKGGLSHSSAVALLCKVDDSIEFLVRHRYLSLDAFDLQTQWRRVFHWLGEKWRLFFYDDECPESAHEDTKAKWKPSPYLKLTGDGGVFPALWQSEGPADIADFLVMCDDMISLRTCQSDTERAGTRACAIEVARDDATAPPPFARAGAHPRHVLYAVHHFTPRHRVTPTPPTRAAAAAHQ